MFEVATLRKIAAYGAAFTAGSCAFFYYKIQSRFASGDYYRLSMEALRADKRLSEALGPPIRPLFLNLGNKENFILADKAQLGIPVRGSKYKGILHTRCTKTEERGWQINSLQLEVNEKRFSVALSAERDPELIE